MSEGAFNKYRQLRASFAGSRRLRLHGDENEDEYTLVYDYFTGSLLDFVRAYNTQLTNQTATQIMWEIGKAIEEMHDQNIMHVGNYPPPGHRLLFAGFLSLFSFLDLKPDNILLNWDPQLPDGGTAPPIVRRVILSDLDSSLVMKGWAGRPTKEFRDIRFGNIRWRAPEMQTGLGIGLFTDVFACALIVRHFSLMSLEEG